MSESALSAKRGEVSLARNQRSPKRPSEQRPKAASTRKRAEWQNVTKPSRLYH